MCLYTRITIHLYDQINLDLARQAFDLWRSDLGHLSLLDQACYTQALKGFQWAFGYQRTRANRCHRPTDPGKRCLVDL